jgi:hypothetical protein
MSLIVTDGAGFPKSLKTTDDVDGIQTPHHNVDHLPGTVEADIGASRGFLQTLVTAISGGKQSVSFPGSAEADIGASKGFLQTLASCVATGRQSVALPGTSEGDIGASRGFLQTLAGAISTGRMLVTLTTTEDGYLSTLAGAVATAKMQADVKTLPGTVAADITTLAGAIATGNMKVAIQAGTNAIGKLAANAGINIGTVDVATLPAIVLQAGTNAIGKLSANSGINIGTVDVAAPSSASTTTVPASVTAVTLLAANATRYGTIIVNNSASATLYGRLATGATSSNWSFILEPGGIWEMQPRYYTGIITGIWSAAVGDAHVTETA